MPTTPDFRAGVRDLLRTGVRADGTPVPGPYAAFIAKHFPRDADLLRAAALADNDPRIVQAFDYANNVREAHGYLSDAVAMYRRTGNAHWNSGASRNVRDALAEAAPDCRRCFPEEVADGGHPWLDFAERTDTADLRAAVLVVALDHFAPVPTGA